MSITISYSANSVYQRSPRAWFLHYQLGIRPKDFKGSFVIGGSIDEALNVLLKTRDKQKAMKEFMKFFTSYQTYIGKVNALKDKGIKFSKTEEDAESWIKKTEMILDAYEVQVLPHIKEVIAVQAYTEIKNNEGDKVRGVADFYAIWEQDKTADNYNPELDKWNGKTILFDNKTSSVKYKPDSVRNSEQLATYLEDTKRDFEVDAAGYIVIPKRFRKKKEPLVPIGIIIDKVDPNVVQSILQQYEDTIYGIKMGNFPCNRGNCDKDFFGCPYKNYCDNHGDMEGLVWAKKDKKKGSN